VAGRETEGGKGRAFEVKDTCGGVAEEDGGDSATDARGGGSRDAWLGLERLSYPMSGLLPSKALTNLFGGTVGFAL